MTFLPKIPTLSRSIYRNSWMKCNPNFVCKCVRVPLCVFCLCECVCVCVCVCVSVFSDYHHLSSFPDLLWHRSIFLWSNYSIVRFSGQAFIIIIIYSLEFFHISVSWWSFTGDWVKASLLKSPGLFSGFWPSSIMQLFRWSPPGRQLPNPPGPLIIL